MKDVSQKTITRKTTPSKKTDRLTALQELVTSDKQLQLDEKKFQLFLTLAKLFEEDLEENLTLTSFELDDKYSTYEPMSWVDFKSFEPVRKYIAKFIEEKQYTEAVRTTTASGGQKTSDAIKIQNTIDDARQGEKNQNIIVFLIPQRNYTKVGDE